jgi:hypothetical protein
MGANAAAPLPALQLFKGCAVENQVRIHVDGKPFESPTPTPGVDLYELVGVRDDRALYKEVTGNAEDKLVLIQTPHVHLTQDEHFHTEELPAHLYLIHVNTDPFFIDHKEVSFEQVVKLAYPVPPGGLDPEFTVSYEHAASVPHHDDMTKGQKVEVKKHGTTFDVAHTNRS